MGYVLTVRLKQLSDSIIPQWISEINKLNMTVEVSPKFSFSGHGGFLPFRTILYDCPNQSLNHVELMTGYELYVRKMERTKDSFFRSLMKGKSGANIFDTEVDFRISAQDSFEYRMGWYSAASLALVCKGVLIDPQEGLQLEGQQLIEHAHRCVLEDEKTIKDDEWRIHRFEGWKG